MKKPTISEMSNEVAEGLSDLLEEITKFRKRLNDLVIDVEDITRKLNQIEDDYAGD